MLVKILCAIAAGIIIGMPISAFILYIDLRDKVGAAHIEARKAAWLIEQFMKLQGIKIEAPASFFDPRAKGYGYNCKVVIIEELKEVRK